MGKHLTECPETQTITHRRFITSSIRKNSSRSHSLHQTGLAMRNEVFQCWSNDPSLVECYHLLLLTLLHHARYQRNVRKAQCPSSHVAARQAVHYTGYASTLSLKTMTLALPMLTCTAIYITSILIDTSLHANPRRSSNKIWSSIERSRMHPPQHVWDLYANRVVPYWAAIKLLWPMSHAWLDEKDLKRVMTPINGYKWPMPILKDADLNLIRIEMLNLSAEYICSDVLCLRQEGWNEDPCFAISQEEWDEREALCKEEWKVDMPTIGCVYPLSIHVICYLSGLGLLRYFKTARDFEDDRCWFNQVWTLQEISDDMLIAGKTYDDDNDDMVDERFMTVDMQWRMDGQLTSLHQDWGLTHVQKPRYLSSCHEYKNGNQPNP